MLYLCICFIWITSEIILNRIFRAGQEDKQHSDRRSLITIWVTIMIVMPVAQYISGRYSNPINSYEYTSYFGMGMIVAGMLFRFIAVYTLGRYFTVNVTIRRDHKIIQQGLYKYLRHPSYLGSLFSFLGNGFALNNWYGMLIVFIPVTLAFMNRMRVEEELLISNFGQEYIDYKKRTWRLIPFVY
ncbi:Isoprenylcysteine carboxyl methyltransferase (ICMT) family protein [Chitinophaga sp. YR573]|uniref:methyltransferase family protein n=1 Tax=Chitinophaga sp. YR573 TaxID=1881040 RepID=UPI0008C279A0|nr:isoprenylcysteine carboxylmethyltransferase family protein [Chitinophaga sp. YR573]SEW11290.1 Isoprenylcysteine carboxyl methyltransferase (ICMT) family protein [Chitinophaga sp. YR573]